MDIIEARINYSIKDKVLFDDININISEGSFVSIVGLNGSGKSTLLKILSGSIITNNNVKIDNLQVNKYNINDIDNKVSFIKSNNEFFSKTVLEEILECKRLNNAFEVNKVRKLLNEFNLLYLENVSPLDLSYAENQIVALIKAIVKGSKIIFLDNAFIRLDIDKRKELFGYLKDYSKKNNITVVATSNNIYDIKYSDRLLFIKDNTIYFDGNYNDFITNIDLNKEGFKEPWEVEVSNKLIMYGLVNNMHVDIMSLVGELCN